MGHRARLIFLAAMLAPAAPAGAGSVLSVHGHFGHQHHGGPPPGLPGRGSPGSGGFGGGGPYYGGVGGSGYGYAIPYVAVPYPTFVPVPVPMPMPMPMAVAPTRPAPAATARARRHDPAAASEMLTIGDRLFRAGNFTRAVQRYEQSIKADPSKAAARVRLAQVAMVRGQYREAANWLREADTVEPSYLLTAADIRALYLEPGDFTRQVARLEAHLQSHPEDRDSWLLLGAEHYFSGRTREAGDIFLRLTDRRAEPALAAFLSATQARTDR